MKLALKKPRLSAKKVVKYRNDGIRVLLAGNPNSGKTTVFNSLTGENLRTGNYNGVTTGAAEGSFTQNGKIFTVVDLPGTYSLSSARGEEAVASEALKKENSFVLIVAEAANIPSALALAKEIISLKRPCAALVTKYAEFIKRGGTLDFEKLSEYLGVPVTYETDKKRLKQFVCECSLLHKLKENPPILREKGDKTDFSGFFGQAKIQTFTRLDRVLTGNVTGVLSAFAIAAAAMYLAFGRYSVGSFFGEILTRAFSFAASKTGEFLLAMRFPSVASSFVADGIFSGVSGVLGFIPQLAVLYLCSVIIEQSGYIARLSYLFDGTLKRFGLSGRAVFPFLVGFGCTAQAVLVSDGSETERSKRSLILALGFIPCSARLPVIGWLISIFFPEKRFLIILAAYFGGIVLGLLFSYAYSEEGRHKNKAFAFEMPRLTFPNPKICIKQLNFLLKTFIIKTLTVLASVSAAIWFMKSFGTNFEYLGENEISESILAFVGRRISFVFAPMGFTGWQMPVIAISGLIAKEGMLSALFLVGGEAFARSVSPAAALSLIAFSAYYTPCVMSLSAVRGKTNGRFCAIYGLFTFVNGLFAGYFTYFSACIIRRTGLLSVVAVPSLFILFVALYSQIFKLTESIRLKTKFRGGVFRGGKNDITETKDVEIHVACKRKACKTYMCAGCPVRGGYESSSIERRKGKRQT